MSIFANKICEMDYLPTSEETKTIIITELK